MLVKRVSMFLLVLIIATSVLLGCTAPATSRPPETGKAPAPAAAQPSGGRPEVTIKIASGMFGGWGYYLSYALSSLINKHSTWLRAYILETAGTPPSLGEISKSPKSAIGWATTGITLQAIEGKGAFKTAYPTYRALATGTLIDLFMITLDSNIKKMEELAGKRIALGPKGTALGEWMYWPLDYGYGLGDKLKDVKYLKWEEGKNALLDGLVDAQIMSNTLARGGKWLSHPTLDEIRAVKKVYFLGYSKEALEKTRKATGYPFPEIIQPKDAIEPGFPPNDVLAWADANSWWCDATLDNDIAYEVVRIIYEYAAEFDTYAAQGKAIVPEELGHVGVVKELFHPGALKFYAGKGVPVGLK